MDDDAQEGWFSRNRSLLVPAAILLVLAGVVLYFLHDTAGMRREAPPLPTLIATLPPPPPPPPKPPEPEKKIEETPKPIDQPKQQPDDAPKPMTINGPAQAGTDAFGIAAGSGGGDVVGGGGFGEASYSSYMGSTIQQAIENDDRTNTFVGSTEIDVWIDDNGRITRAVLARSSGDAKTDSALVAVLLSMPVLKEAPPSTLRFPQRIRIGGRRRAG